MTKRTYVRFWVFAILGFCLVIWILKPMLLPFVLAAAIAYFLNPVVNSMGRMSALGRKKLPRWVNTLIVLLGFALVMIIVGILVVPLLERQVGALIDAMPGYIESARNSLQPVAEKWMDKLDPEDINTLKEAAGKYAGNAVSFGAKIFQSIVGSGLALFDILTLFLVTPVVAFYLLRDWPRLTASIDTLLPRQHYQTIRAEMASIDRALSGFLRGQALVCMCLGFIYGLGFTLVGLKYGATIGIVAGMLSFMPYIGSSFGLICSMILVSIQFGDLPHYLMALSVFATGQILEGYVLVPKLVGDRIGLHPVWILFALFAGGSLMGFLGVLVAVPLAAIIAVIVRFALRQYKSSGLYRARDFY